MEDIQEMYNDAVEGLMPEQFGEAFSRAILLLKEKHEECETMGCIVDTEKSALVFTIGAFNHDTLKEEEVFYTYPCNLIGECDEWCSQLELDKLEAAKQWLEIGASDAESQGIFEDEGIETFEIQGSYGYDKSGRLGVIYSLG